VNILVRTWAAKLASAAELASSRYGVAHFELSGALNTVLHFLGRQRSHNPEELPAWLAEKEENPNSEFAYINMC
jgi:hypothetical protein